LRRPRAGLEDGKKSQSRPLAERAENRRARLTSAARLDDDERAVVASRLGRAAADGQRVAAGAGVPRRERQSRDDARRARVVETMTATMGQIVSLGMAGCRCCLLVGDAR